MKMLSFAFLALASVAVMPLSAEAGRRGCGCCGSVTYTAPAAASPVAVENVATDATVAQNQDRGYRSYSYQPTAPAMNYNSGAPALNYNSGYSGNDRRSSVQSYWRNGGGNKSMGRVTPYSQ